MIVRAPAKINLSLQITGKDKKDGYHFIRSLFDPVSLYDMIDMVPADYPEIEVIDAFEKLNLKPEKNLVYRAATLLREISGIKKGAYIKLYKYIPDGAGLGGGSSDAAAVLKGLNRLWRINYPVKKLEEIAFKLGSDVPFFIKAKPSVISGKGEKIRVIKRRRICWYVIVVKKGVKVPTPKAYEWYDTDFKLTLSQNMNILSSGRKREKQLSRNFNDIKNDLEPPVFSRKKVLKKVKETLLKCGNVKGAGMSGSGSSVFAVFTQIKAARSCLQKAKKSFKGSFICLAHSV